MKYSDLINKLVTLFYLFVPLGPFFQLSYGIPIAPHIILLVTLFALTLSNPRNYPKKIKVPYLFRYAIVFLLYIFISTIIVIGSEINFDYVNQYFRIITLFSPVVLLLFVNKINIDKIISGYIVGNFIGAIIAFSLLLQGEYYFGGRLTFHYEYNPTAFGAHITFCIILFPQFYNSKYFYRIIKVIILIVFLLALMLSQSRNALIALTLSFLIIFMFAFVSNNLEFGIKGTLKKLAIVVSILFVVTFSLWYGYNLDIYDEVYFSRTEMLTQLNGSNLDQATADRTTNWINYLNEPLTLLGTGFSPEGYIPAGYRHSPHNTYILLLYKSGVVGVLLYLGFIFLLLRASIKNDQFYFILTWAGLFFLLFGIGNDIIYYTYFWIPLSLWFALYLKSKNDIT